jgi:hypothetical protein
MELFNNCPFCDFPIYGKIAGPYRYSLGKHFCDKGDCRRFSQNYDEYTGEVYYTSLNFGNFKIALRQSMTDIFKDNQFFQYYSSGKYLGINLEDYLKEASDIKNKEGKSFSIKSTYIPPANISLEKQPSFIDAYKKMEELKSSKNGELGWHFEIVEENK